MLKDAAIRLVLEIRNFGAGLDHHMMSNHFGIWSHKLHLFVFFAAYCTVFGVIMILVLPPTGALTAVGVISIWAWLVWFTAAYRSDGHLYDGNGLYPLIWSAILFCQPTITIYGLVGMPFGPQFLLIVVFAGLVLPFLYAMYTFGAVHSVGMASVASIISATVLIFLVSPAFMWLVHSFVSGQSNADSVAMLSPRSSEEIAGNFTIETTPDPKDSSWMGWVFFGGGLVITFYLNLLVSAIKGVEKIIQLQVPERVVDKHEWLTEMGEKSISIIIVIVASEFIVRFLWNASVRLLGGEYGVAMGSGAWHGTSPTVISAILCCLFVVMWTYEVQPVINDYRAQACYSD
nr:hypothetical protein [uncultured Hyphomonas sp.]